MSEVRIKRVFDPAEPEDGARILVDRLWPRGVSRDRAALTGWLKSVAPSHELRKQYHASPDGWEAFATAYRAELDEPDAQAGLAELRRLASEGVLTLLYSVRDPERNHAAILRGILLAL